MIVTIIANKSCTYVYNVTSLIHILKCFPEGITSRDSLKLMKINTLANLCMIRALIP